MHVLPRSQLRIQHCFRPLLAAALGLTLAGGLSADQPVQPAVQAGGVEPEQLATATRRGTRWLVAAQQDDGSWGSGGFRGSAAVTAHGVLALVGSGSTPIAGPHATTVRRAVEFLQRHCDADGLIAGNEAAAHGPMYGHAYATLALAEVWGERVGDDLQDCLTRATALIAGTQNAAGGWRYQPIAGEADISVTASMLVALRGLGCAGVAVEAATADRAIDYIIALQNDDGGFRYRMEPGPSGSPRTAAALFALQLAGVQGQVIDRGFAWLEAHPISLGTQDGYALYGLAAEAAARWQQRLATGDVARWQEWFHPVATALLEHQQEDGSWPDPSCPEYGTAAGLVILQTPAGLVPIVAAEGRREGLQP